MRGEAGLDQRSQIANNIMKDAAANEEEEIEMRRRNEEGEEDEGNADNARPSIDMLEQDPMQEIPEEDFPLHQDEDEMQVTFDAEGENLAKHEQAAGFAEDMPGMASPARSEHSQMTGFSLGAVNDLEEEISGESRQEQGDTLVSSGSKWHKHTVKVLDMLKKNMTSDEDDGEKPKDLSYDKLSYGVSRRTACGVFFELLQLKTWDFIELSQEESYSDIKIAPGVRFDEAPPTE